MSDVPNGRALSRCFLIDENDKYSLNHHKYLIKVLDRNKYYLSFMVDRGENIDNMPVIHPQARRLIKLYDKINKTINEIQIQKAQTIHFTRSYTR
ncbi:hypothetical protein [Lebetimonas sp. JH292]|uniref:hypothetical protein n=1 Tax=Lebetimonas sp. JH292 TaxID=990068 RepID=UPI0012EB2349|nr:hypothetical protein [Lebetimonas sp. JH292]